MTILAVKELATSRLHEVRHLVFLLDSTQTPNPKLIPLTLATVSYHHIPLTLKISHPKCCPHLPLWKKVEEE